jgi:hypothetical protein
MAFEALLGAHQILLVEAQHAVQPQDERAPAAPGELVEHARADQGAGRRCRQRPAEGEPPAADLEPGERQHELRRDWRKDVLDGHEQHEAGVAELLDEVACKVFDARDHRGIVCTTNPPTGG